MRFWRRPVSDSRSASASHAQLGSWTTKRRLKNRVRYQHQAVFEPLEERHLLTCSESIPCLNVGWNAPSYWDRMEGGNDHDLKPFTAFSLNLVTGENGGSVPSQDFDMLVTLGGSATVGEDYVVLARVNGPSGSYLQPITPQVTSGDFGIRFPDTVALSL